VTNSKDSKQAERAKTSLFLQRVKQAKLDLPANKALISGLYEDSTWKFICAEHPPARFLHEVELKKHFQEKAHKNRFPHVG
jgi:hypothetical protein